MQVYEIEQKSVNFLDFTCDFTGSTGVTVINKESIKDQAAPLCCTATIDPAGKAIVGRLGYQQGYRTSC